MAWMMSKQAIRIANECEDCMNPSMMTKRLRAFLFHGKLCMEMKAFKKGLQSFENAIQVALVLLSVLTKAKKTPKNEAKVTQTVILKTRALKQNGMRWGNTLRLMALDLVNMAICFEFLGQYAKSLEASRHAEWIVSFLPGNEQVSRNVLSFRDSIHAKYSSMIKAIAEIERIVFCFFEKNLEYLSSDEESPSTLRGVTSFEEDLAPEPVSKEEEEEELSKSLIIQERNKGSKTLAKFKKLLMEESDSPYNEMFLRSFPSNPMLFASLAPDQRDHQGNQSPKSPFQIKKRPFAGAFSSFSGKTNENWSSDFIGKQPSGQMSSTADQNSQTLSKFGSAQKSPKKAESNIALNPKFGEEYSPKALTSNKCIFLLQVKRLR